MFLRFEFLFSEAVYETTHLHASHTAQTSKEHDCVIHALFTGPRGQRVAVASRQRRRALFRLGSIQASKLHIHETRGPRRMDRGFRQTQSTSKGGMVRRDAVRGASRQWEQGGDLMSERHYAGRHVNVSSMIRVPFQDVSRRDKPLETLGAAGSCALLLTVSDTITHVRLSPWPRLMSDAQRAVST